MSRSFGLGFPRLLIARRAQLLKSVNFDDLNRSRLRLCSTWLNPELHPDRSFDLAKEHIEHCVCIIRGLNVSVHSGVETVANVQIQASNSGFFIHASVSFDIEIATS